MLEAPFRIGGPKGKWCTLLDKKHGWVSIETLTQVDSKQGVQ